jgi:hypothetical protein
MKFDFGSVNWMTVIVAVVLAVIVVKIWRWTRVHGYENHYLFHPGSHPARRAYARIRIRVGGFGRRQRIQHFLTYDCVR